MHPRAAKELERIETPTKTKIVERLMDLKENPEKVGKILKPTNFWSLRIGDYCAIYEIDKTRKQVIVLFIGHRKRVYDDFSKLFNLAENTSSLKNKRRI